MVLDNIKYPLKIIYNDNKQLANCIKNNTGDEVIVYELFSTESIRYIRVICGFYYDKMLVRDVFKFRELLKIDVERLNEHLQKVAKISEKQALSRIVLLLKNKNDRHKILALSKKDRKKIANLVLSFPKNKKQIKLVQKIINSKNAKPRFIKHKNGVVKDKSTGLGWFFGTKDITWNGANKWVSKLNDHNFDGGKWRMPTIEELSDIYKKDKTQNIELLFDYASFYVWSNHSLNDNALVFSSFLGSFWNKQNASKNLRVFAVRNGK